MAPHGQSQPPSIHPTSDELPRPPVQQWVKPLVRFLEIESASGVLLLVCAIAALVLANSPWAGVFLDFWKIPFRVGLGPWERVGLGPWGLDWSLLHWINDGLMTIFFFVVGLEIKRELVAGELREARKAALPVAAALGGMVAPAVIYAVLLRGQPGSAGWGIPMATDIAFVVGFLALLGPRVPLGLKILLLSLAIADDIGAVLVIAVFYSTGVSWAALGCAAAGFALTYFLNRIGVRHVAFYVIVGAGVWLAFAVSGVHPTVAGVLLGLLTPSRAWIGEQTLANVAGGVFNRLLGGNQEAAGQEVAGHGAAPQRYQVLRQLGVAAREAVSPLERLETALHPWVAFGIMPLFALANAGVRVEATAFGETVAMAVAAGLVFGKPLGIVLFSYLAVRAGLARLPTGVNWRIMLGAGCLAGIGFTMSLFIASLALEGELLDAGKIGTLAGSAVSATVGCLLLRAFLPPAAARQSLIAAKSDVHHGSAEKPAAPNTAG
jgi:NhaA family Na+:H+ antiporter